MQKFKAADIHHPGVTEEFDRLTGEDLQRLLRRKNEFVDTACPACHGSRVENSFEYQGLNYRRCLECELLYVSPAPTEAMHLEYVIQSTAMAYWRETANPKMKDSRKPMYQERVEYSQQIFEQHRAQPGSSLEIGAGNGEFAEELRRGTDIDQIVVLEPQPLDLDSSEFEIVTGGFDALGELDRKFDVVFAWELIEHLLEPDIFLGLVRSVMHPGALFILSTPNEKSLETRKLGKDSSNILFDHVRLYNPDAIERLFSRNGFRIVDLSTPGLLDVEKLQSYLKDNPGAFDDDLPLKFLLACDEQITQEFQEYLRANLYSSHMRIVAVRDGESAGGQTPRLDSNASS